MTLPSTAAVPPEARSPESVPVHDLATLRELMMLLARRWRTSLLLPLAGAAAFVAYAFLAPRAYVATASFMPVAAGNASRSGMMGIAAQLGVNLPGQDPSQSPAFYSSLLTSRTILQEVVTVPLDVGGGRRSNVMDLLDVHGDTPSQRVDLAVAALRDRLTVRTNAETGLVEFGVRMRSAAAAAAVAQRILVVLNDFNLRTRQARASAEMQFIEGRMQDANAELRASQDRLESFLEENRNYAMSPHLSVTHDRLLGDMSMRQTLYTTLAQAFEQSRIDAVRNTPLITLVDSPEVPSRPAPRGTIQKAILGLVLGAILGVLIAIYAEARQTKRGLRPGNQASPVSALT